MLDNEPQTMRCHGGRIGCHLWVGNQSIVIDYSRFVVRHDAPFAEDILSCVHVLYWELLQNIQKAKTLLRGEIRKDIELCQLSV